MLNLNYYFKQAVNIPRFIQNKKQAVSSLLRFNIQQSNVAKNKRTLELNKKYGQHLKFILNKR